MDEPCPMCDAPVSPKRERFFIKPKAKEREGPYCSRLCAKQDSWGPAFRNARVYKVPPKKRRTQ